MDSVRQEACELVSRWTRRHSGEGSRGPAAWGRPAEPLAQGLGMEGGDGAVPCGSVSTTTRRAARLGNTRSRAFAFPPSLPSRPRRGGGSRACGGLVVLTTCSRGSNRPAPAASAWDGPPVLEEDRRGLRIPWKVPIGRPVRLGI